MVKNSQIAIGLIFSAILLTSVLVENFTIVNTQSHVILDITVSDTNGNIISHTHETKDMMLTNWARYWCDMFQGSGSRLNLKSTDGTIFTPYPSNAIYFSGSDALMWLGTGTTSATIQDYHLNSVYMTSEPSSNIYSWSGPGHYQYNCTLVSLYTVTSGATVSESGLSVNVCSGVSTYKNVLLFRDVFVGFAVTPGQVITQKYTFVMNG